MNNQIIGRFGEDRACDHLIKNGYQILERNFRCREGELDIIAQDGPVIVFVEVKTRSTSLSGHPFEAITPVKQARIRRVAAQWCAANQISRRQVRMDAIAVLLAGNRVSIEHLKQVG